MAEPLIPEHAIPGDAEPHPGFEPDEVTMVNSPDDGEAGGHGA